VEEVMPAAKHDITIEQGSTFKLGFAWRGDGGSIVDLTGYKARMQIRETVASEAKLLDATTENGFLSIDAADGTVTLEISATVTAGYSWVRGRYDLELEAPDGTVTRLIEGNATLSKEVTRG
jgi:hypothetical protein